MCWPCRSRYQLSTRSSRSANFPLVLSLDFSFQRKLSNTKSDPPATASSVDIPVPMKDDSPPLASFSKRNLNLFPFIFRKNLVNSLDKKHKRKKEQKAKKETFPDTEQTFNSTRISQTSQERQIALAEPSRRGTQHN